jgi:hypothetical protein
MFSQPEEPDVTTYDLRFEKPPRYVPEDAPERQPSTPPDAKPLSMGTPSLPVLGVLPLARLIPQDIHTGLDYLGAGQALLSSVLANDPVCRMVGLVQAAMAVSVASMTDDRLSFAKKIPIEVHEVIDHVWGLGLALAPFALGYWKKSPVASAIQVGTGLFYVAASLLTDYRAARGVKWARVSGALTA